MATFNITQKAVILRAEDDVAVAKAEIPAGTILEDGGSRIEVRQDIKPGHKVARRAVRAGAPVRRYGQIIGFATEEIRVGDHIHTQNLGIGALQREYEFCTDVRPVDFHPPEAMRTFDGFKRDDVVRLLDDLRARGHNYDVIDGDAISDDQRRELYGQAFLALAHSGNRYRIRQVFPEYDKVIVGNLIALDIGLARMCQESPHFRQWFERLRAIGAPPGPLG